MSELNTPPKSIEAEQAVIGGLLQDNHILDDISVKLSPEDFYQNNHRLIYEHIQKLVIAEQTADIITVGEALERSAKLEAIGGIAYLGSLVQGSITANIRRYAEIVYEHAIRRSLIHLCSDLAEQAYRPKEIDTSTLLDEASQKMLSLAESGKNETDSITTVRKVLPEVMDKLDKLYLREGQSVVTGTPTGFTDLDEKTSGLHEGDLVIVAGRPSMGKTAFAINMAENVALNSKLPVIVFSLEMPAEQLATRMIGSVGRLDQQKLRTGKLEDEDWERLTTAVGLLDQAQIYIDETAGLTALDLRAKARKIYKACGGQLGLIVIDYIQLMSGPANRASENRTTEVSEISRAIKALAKELKVPIVALSQLNRSVESRNDKRPMMSDIRESGAIEQDADIIMFVYRDEYYNKDSTDKGTAEIIIGKQRNGPVGTVGLAFQGQYTKFEDLAMHVEEWH